MDIIATHYLYSCISGVFNSASSFFFFSQSVVSESKEKHAEVDDICTNI